MMLVMITPVSVIIRYDIIWRIDLDGKMNSRCLIGLERVFAAFELTLLIYSFVLLVYMGFQALHKYIQLMVFLRPIISLLTYYAFCEVIG
ncbi:hypothetical protein Hanom_Chr09g00807431 [Helianthus anomalus]